MSSMMTVSSLNTKIKSLLEATFMHILVEGEVASVTYHSSGHLYFSIKDDKSAIKCVMWRSSVARMKFRIEKGMHIVVEGSVSVYTPRGEYQFQTVRIEPYGKGALALAYEQLKERLKAKGYFDAHRKKPIPKSIRKIALVTARESAALYDMLKIIEKRWPLLEVTIVDTLVQGESAAGQIAHALRYADTLEADVVVVGRGGGSTEDLWCFNEELVADAIFAMQTPVVSAVGHEVDVMISDLVADLRAPTPSAAMEMILPDLQEILYTLSEYEERFKQAITSRLTQSTRELKHVKEMLHRSSPLRRLEESKMEFKRMEEEFKRMISYRMERFESVLPSMRDAYVQTMQFTLQRKEQHLDHLMKKLRMSDPRSQCRIGWAQVSQGGKPIALASIEKNAHFILEDASTKIEAVCVDKKRLYDDSI
ncbi:exodeoxyribonuclease VII large subunit [Sulfurovum sp. NBC37-1]|uniref:exodeoxyribonuclease VII large subunit n=1 Tax=Sulfurovum sp. (strain NBC37-1) TaxID=387093 RepID=UPI0001587D2C|nr:exodeoxyribonuclease VII large subunit [Sulfurovum sp. NBC37-1]BAF72909.1 exodeoxyribonuclease VII, large subunit [Sulfurovum sp. NBC37-1]